MPDNKNILIRNIGNIERKQERGEKYETKKEEREAIQLEKEKSIESEPVQIEKLPESQEGKSDGKEIAGGVVASTQTSQKHKEREKKIEEVLADDLEEMYLKMSPEKRQEFKTRGEQTAKEINNLLNQTKVKVKRIIDLIKKWLSMLPGVNKFFLEQEAKIKTDKIMALKNNKE